MHMTYFDNGSTSFPKAPGVGAAMENFISNGAFNINRGGYEGAYDVEAEVLDTRNRLAKLFGAKDSRNVIFTPNITYSLNMVLKGLLKSGDQIITSSMEHNAVMRPLNQLQKDGVIVLEVKANREGYVDPQDIKSGIKNNTKAVVITHASNVCGSVMPIKDIGCICKDNDILFIVDSAQTAGTLPIDMKRDNIDFLTFTGHKGLLGPQGIGGFLVSEKGRGKLEPLILGGTGSFSDSFLMPELLPDRFESGTLNLPGIIGLNQALKYIEETGIAVLNQKKMKITKLFLEEAKKLNGVQIIGNKEMDNRVSVVSLQLEGIDMGRVSFLLESEYGVMTRVGLQCAPAAHKSLGTFPEGTLRFSFGSFNTEAEVYRCVEGLTKILEPS